MTDWAHGANHNHSEGSSNNFGSFIAQELQPGGVVGVVVRERHSLAIQQCKGLHRGSFLLMYEVQHAQD